MQRIALVVSGRTGPELVAGSADAAAFWAVLLDPTLGNCAPNPISRLVVDASRADFGTALESLLSNWRAEDQLVFYFTGHGRYHNDVYALEFLDSSANSYKYTLFDSLLLEFEAAGVTRCVAILDACYSGAAVKGDDDAHIYQPSAKALPLGFGVIASSSAIETSRELPDGSNSIFTALVVEVVRRGIPPLRAEADTLVLANL